MSQVICDSFKVEIFQGIHDFTAGTGDVFKMALYTSAAPLSASTTVYTTANETSGAGYVPGGITLTTVTPALVGSTAVVDFDDVIYGPVSLTYSQMLLYNSSKANRAVAVFNFGSNRTISSGNLVIQMPTPNATNGILRAA